MANNIVQLKDYNGNDVFPIAGGMDADSITTQMLKNSSVTSDKIDSATIDLHNYKTSLITGQGARAIMTIKGGIGMITTAGDTTSGSGAAYDNIPVKVPFTQELMVTTNRANETSRCVIENGTNPNTSKISVAAGITFPANLYIKGPFITV